MRFIVQDLVFEKLPELCFGVVLVKGINNKKEYPSIGEILNAGQAAATRFSDHAIKEDSLILPYREAFRALGINPNKFMSSIEAMYTRVSKGQSLPSINPIVDLGNALSLKYVLPIGAHDLRQMDGDIEVRFSTEGDLFIPFGEAQAEKIPLDELIYTVGHKVRTRRWIWRQSELGKITGESRDIFFPIDGFSCSNLRAILEARDELAALAARVLKCTDVRVGFVDRAHPEMEL